MIRPSATRRFAAPSNDAGLIGSCPGFTPRACRSAAARSMSCCVSINVLAGVGVGKPDREGLALARRHAARGGLELRQHAAFAERKDEALGLAAVEGLAGDGPLEIDRQAIGVARRTARRHEARA